MEQVRKKRCKSKMTFRRTNPPALEYNTIDIRWLCILPLMYRAKLPFSEGSKSARSENSLWNCPNCEYCDVAVAYVSCLLPFDIFRRIEVKLNGDSTSGIEFSCVEFVSICVKSIKIIYSHANSTLLNTCRMAHQRELQYWNQRSSRGQMTEASVRFWGCSSFLSRYFLTLPTVPYYCIIVGCPCVVRVGNIPIFTCILPWTPYSLSFPCCNVLASLVCNNHESINQHKRSRQDNWWRERYRSSQYFINTIHIYMILHSRGNQLYNTPAIAQSKGRSFLYLE